MGEIFWKSYLNIFVQSLYEVNFPHKKTPTKNQANKKNKNKQKKMKSDNDFFW